MSAALQAGIGPLGYAAVRVATALSREQVKQGFIDRGETVTEWARRAGFGTDMAAVYRVLNGQSPARRGKHHQIAVALGLKAEGTAT